MCVCVLEYVDCELSVSRHTALCITRCAQIGIRSMHHRMLFACFFLAGAVPSTKCPDASPASTVPADDDTARAQAIASYQNSKMKTPEERIRRMPATPTVKQPTLSREVQSVEVLGSGGETEKKGDRKPSSQKSKAKKRNLKVKGKSGKSKTKSTTKDKKTSAPKPADKTPRTSVTPTGSGTSIPAVAANPPSGPQSTLLPRQCSVIGSPDLTENQSPVPESVQSTLNRAQTGDLLDANALPGIAAAGALKAGDMSQVKDGTRVRVRDKEYHNRRMRFYRSLESFLTEYKCMRTYILDKLAMKYQNMCIVHTGAKMVWITVSLWGLFFLTNHVIFQASNHYSEITQFVLRFPWSLPRAVILGSSAPDEIVKLGENARSGKGPRSIKLAMNLLMQMSWPESTHPKCNMHLQKKLEFEAVTCSGIP